MHLEPVRAALGPLLTQGRLATCAIVDLEVLYSTQGSTDYEETLAKRRSNYTDLPITPEVCWRAIDVQRRLAQRGQHRVAGIPDMLIAACAEAHGVTVLHYDQDFAAISGVTGQPVQWVVPRASVS